MIKAFEEFVGDLFHDAIYGDEDFVTLSLQDLMKKVWDEAYLYGTIEKVQEQVKDITPHHNFDMSFGD